MPHILIIDGAWDQRQSLTIRAGAAILIATLVPRLCIVSARNPKPKNRFYIAWKPLVGCTDFLASATFQCLDKGTAIAWLLDSVSSGITMVPT